MKDLLISMATLALATTLIVAGCTQPASAPAPPTQTLVEGTEPTKAAAPSAPTTAPEPTKDVDFPQKGRPITIIVPLAAGGSTDVMVRLMTPIMEKELGVPIQVLNKPGAAHQVGLTEMTKSKPDGYTLSTTNLPSAMAPYLDPSKQAAFGRKDIAQVANIVWDPESLAVRKDSPFQTMKDLIDTAKTRPVTIADTGILSVDNIAIKMLEKVAGVKFSIVHFDGSAPGMTALLGGHVDAVLYTVGSVAPQVRTGDARILGIMDSQESKFFPGIKTFEAQGYKAVMASSRGMSVPAGTPEGVINILAAAIKKAAEDPQVKAKLEEQSLPLYFLGPKEYTAYWDEMEAQVKPLVDEILKESATK